MWKNVATESKLLWACYLWLHSRPVGFVQHWSPNSWQRRHDRSGCRGSWSSVAPRIVPPSPRRLAARRLGTTGFHPPGRPPAPLRSWHLPAAPDLLSDRPAAAPRQGAAPSSSGRSTGSRRWGTRNGPDLQSTHRTSHPKMASPAPMLTVVDWQIYGTYINTHVMYVHVRIPCWYPHELATGQVPSGLSFQIPASSY